MCLMRWKPVAILVFSLLFFWPHTSRALCGSPCLSPSTAPVGTVVRITNGVFGSTIGSVSFNGTLATITSWSNTFIVTTVPAGATTGNVVVTTSSGPLSGQNFTVTPGTPTSGYGFHRAVTLDHTKVPNTDQVNFPVLISGTYSYLATTANGGNVTSTSGLDIVFTSDAAGTTALPFERESYSSTNGQVNFWVRVPIVSHTVDTVIYVFYGNSAANDQSNGSAVWDTNYVAVYHLGDNAASTSVFDSTSNFEYGTATASTNTKAATGKIDGALNFNGTADSIAVPQNGNFNFHASPFTVSGWMKDDTSASILDNPKHRVFSWYDGTKNIQLGFSSASSETTRVIYMFVGTSTASVSAGTTGNLSTGYHYVVGTFDGASTLHIYVDGVQVDGGTFDGGVTTFTANSTTLYLGQLGNGTDFVNGQMDEIRISKAVRSADWTLTEYRNQTSPGTFYTIGVASGGGSGSYGFSRAITIDHTKVPNTDQTNFPLLISGTYSYLATAANGGNVTNANGFDIIFASDSGGVNTLSYERESYSAATGQVNLWVKVPIVSHTTDTVIYMLYGNSSVTTDQSNKNAVWDANYVAVYHLGDNAANTTVSDSTSNAENGTAAANTSTKTGTGKIGAALNFNGTSDSISIPQNGKFNLHASPFTLSGWMKDDTSASILDNPKHRVVSWYDGTKNIQFGFSSAASETQRVIYSFVGTSTASVSAGTTGNLSTGYHYVVGTFDGASTLHIYVDGVQLDGGTFDGGVTTFTANSTTLYLGQLGNGADFVNGQLDEIRISKAVRSADWTLTEYRNQTGPGTFYSIGSASSGSPAPTITRLIPPSGPVNRSVTIVGTTFGSTLASNTVTFNGQSAVVTSASPTIVIATVPTGATTGAVVVTVGGVNSNSKTFTVTSTPVGPSITSASPTSSLSPGTQVTISGNGFGAFQGSGIVILGNKFGVVVSWADTQIVATLAQGPQTGLVKVMQNGIWSNSVPLTVSCF
jgi:uncharacterized protein (TIGR03437 family)